MSRRILMGDLLLRCKRRVDRETDESIGDAEWQSLISEKYAELCAVVAETGLRYFEAEQTYTMTGAVSYDEPEAHMSTVFVQQVYPDGRRRDLSELMPLEQARWSGLRGSAQRYALIDDQLCLFPTPPAGEVYAIRYTYQPIDLTDYEPTDSVDYVEPAGLPFLIWGTAVLALSKSESDTTLAERHEDRYREQLMESALLRSLESPRRRVFVSDPADCDDPDWGCR